MPRSLSAASATGDTSVRHERSLSELSHQQLMNGSEAATMDTCRRLLRRYIECPICFLYYPQNTNYTRCCHKPICTECFVQIKRKIEDASIASTHCPYCVEPNLGVIYYPPSITTGAAIPPPSSRPSYMRHRTRLSSNLSQGSLSETFREPSIIMTDDIRPSLQRELQAELMAKHRDQLRSAENMALIAAATRRSSGSSHRQSPSHPHPPALPSRPAMRLFGPVSPPASTSSPTQTAVPEYMAYITAMHAAGRVDLEEFLIQEAIRQSLADQEPPANNDEAVSHSNEPVNIDGTASHSNEPVTEDDESGEIPVAAMLDDLDIADHSEAQVPDDAPLTLDDAELDAIANVTSRPRLAVSAVTSPVLTATTPALPDDLMTFGAVDSDAIQSPSSPLPPPLPNRS
ncbi:SNF1-interacting protein, partial [Coemansia aciculifera]